MSAVPSPPVMGMPVASPAMHMHGQQRNTAIAMDDVALQPIVEPSVRRTSRTTVERTIPACITTVNADHDRITDSYPWFPLLVVCCGFVYISYIVLSNSTTSPSSDHHQSAAYQGLYAPSPAPPSDDEASGFLGVTTWGWIVFVGVFAGSCLLSYEMHSRAIDIDRCYNTLTVRRNYMPACWRSDTRVVDLDTFELSMLRFTPRVFRRRSVKCDITMEHPSVGTVELHTTDSIRLCEVPDMNAYQRCIQQPWVNYFAQFVVQAVDRHDPSSVVVTGPSPAPPSDSHTAASTEGAAQSGDHQPSAVDHQQQERSHLATAPNSAPVRIVGVTMPTPQQQQQQQAPSSAPGGVGSDDGDFV